MSKTSQGRTAYVGNIDQRVTLEQLYELFIQLSPVAHISYPRDKLTQEYLGYAFVEFVNDKDLEYVLRLLKEMDNEPKVGNIGNTSAEGSSAIKLYGKPLRIRARTNVGNANTGFGDNSNGEKGVEMPIAKLFVKNLPPEITLATLNKVFGKIGPLVTSATSFVSTEESKKRKEMRKGKKEGITSGRATVCFKYYRDADRAINALNGEMLANQRISVEYALKGNGSQGRYGSSSDRYLNEQAEKNGLL